MNSENEGAPSEMSFYRVTTTAGCFDSLPATAGPWSRHAQHAGPPSALLLKTIEDRHIGVAQRIGRVSVDLLGPIPVDQITVETSVVKPGRRTQLVEAVGSVGGRAVIVVRAWCTERVPSDYPSTEPLPHAAATEGPEPPGSHSAPIPGANLDGYLGNTDFRFTAGGFDRLGPAAAWGRSRCSLLPDVEVSPWQRVLIIADSASGLSLAAAPRTHPAINCDLHVVLHRDPIGEWIHVDAQTRSVVDGGAVAYSTISDRAGSVGRCTQTLYASVAEPAR